MESNLNIIPWIINSLLIVLLTVAGFSIKSFVAQVKEMGKEKVNKEACDLTHERIDEKYDEIKDRADERHEEVKNSLSDIQMEIKNQNGFAETFAEVGQEIVKAIQEKK